MRTKNPALIRSQERRDRELKKINTILILPIEKKSRSSEIDQTEANRGRKKETHYTEKQEGRKKREDRSRREKKITQKEIKRAIGRAKDKVAPDKDG